MACRGNVRTALALLLLLPGLAFAVGAAPAIGHANRVGDQVIVLFENGPPEDLALALPPAVQLLATIPELQAAVLGIHPEMAPSALAALEARPDVRDAYLSSYLWALALPNDPLLSQQWGAFAIGMPEAWEHGLGSRLARVAVLDTGVDYNHKDLFEPLFQSGAGDFEEANRAYHSLQCGPDADTHIGIVRDWPQQDHSAQDEHGHGTHVIGTVAAVANNRFGVVGMAQACVMAVQVLDAGGRGTPAEASLGIVHAANAGVHIISMSLGWYEYDPLLEAAVKYAWNRGVLIVAAAGNNRCGEDTVAYPARFDEVLAVSALAEPGEEVADFSSCGPPVDIAAPGANITSTTLGGGFGMLSGTSMAAPHVSGVAALVKSENLLLTHIQLRCILEATADDLYEAGRDPRTGWGRLDAAEAVAAANSPLGLGC